MSSQGAKTTAHSTVCSTGQGEREGGAGGAVQWGGVGGGGFNKITFYWPLSPTGVFVCLRA